jgi:uncharacterized protein
MNTFKEKISTPQAVLGIVLGLSFIIVGIIASVTAMRIRTYDNAISVTGSAKVAVRSDSAKWGSKITRQVKASGMKGGYEQLAKDLAEVKVFMKVQGINEKMIVIQPVQMNEVYQQYPQPEKEYTLDQYIEVNSPDVDKIAAVTQNVSALVQKGVFYSTTSTEYFYSKLPETRVSLLGEALKDARARAEKLVEGTGQAVGKVRSISSGVVQVMSANSTEVQDYGMYDTSRIEKEVMVTVKSSFIIR